MTLTYTITKDLKNGRKLGGFFLLLCFLIVHNSPQHIVLFADTLFSEKTIRESRATMWHVFWGGSYWKRGGKGEGEVLKVFERDK